MDYNKTFFPVVKHSALRTLLAAVALYDLLMLQMDIKTASVYGDLSEEIYMDQPKGFEIPGREKEVCKLVKCIYGLKQAPR